MNDTVADAEREEIEKLLPWYVMGTLTGDDMTRVETFLARHPDLLHQLDLIRAEREQTVGANEALASPSDGMLRRLMNALPAPQTSVARRSTASVRAFFRTPSARGVQWAAVIAFLLILAQAAVIAGLLVGNGGHSYQEASGPPQNPGVAALVGFSDDATAAAIARLLADFDANIVDGPKPGGVYKIRIRTLERSQRTQRALLARLAEHRDLVRFVLPGRD